MFSLPEEKEHIVRYNRLPSYVRIFLEHNWLRRFALPAVPAVCGLISSVAVKLAGGTAAPAILALGVAGSGAYIFRFLKEIEQKDFDRDGDKEPTFGQLVLFNSRTAEVFDEGFVMSMPGAEIVERSKVQFNEDLVIGPTLFRLDSIDGTPTDSFYNAVSYAFRTPAPADISAGGSANVTIGVTFERDWTQGHSVLDYDEVGETQGALDIIKDAIEADLREIGRRINWLQATFATDLLSAHLIAKLTGEKSFRNKKFPEQDIFENPNPDFIQAFLDDVRINGRSYVRGLGLRIRRLEVKSVDPTGKLKEAAEKIAIARLEAKVLDVDVKANLSAAEAMLEKFKDGSLSAKEALNFVAMNDSNSKIQKTVVELEATQIQSIADAVMRWLETKGNK